ncbi:MAG: hypothetical protein WB816_10970 [Methylocystis sp.]
MQGIKIGHASNLVVATAAGLGVGLCFILLGGTAIGYAAVAAIVVAAILWVMFDVIV